ncbi:MAG: hypothetical protein ACI8WB_003908, partial [Phenylobacterium sp.]
GNNRHSLLHFATNDLGGLDAIHKGHLYIHQN